MAGRAVGRVVVLACAVPCARTVARVSVLDTPAPAPSRRAVLARLALSALVGVAVSVLALPTLAGVLFGAWPLALSAVVLLLAAAIGCLGVLYRATGGLGSRYAWAASVALGGTVLAAATAIWWEASGRDFGRLPLLWHAGVGFAFALSAAVGTRRTRLPAAAVVGLLVVLIGSQLASAVSVRLPDSAPRGCIASSAEEAERTCP